MDDEKGMPEPVATPVRELMADLLPRASHCVDCPCNAGWDGRAADPTPEELP